MLVFVTLSWLSLLINWCLKFLLPGKKNKKQKILPPVTLLNSKGRKKSHNNGENGEKLFKEVTNNMISNLTPLDIWEKIVKVPPVHI